MNRQSERTAIDSVDISFLDTQVGRVSIATSKRGLLALGWDTPAGLAQRLGAARSAITPASVVPASGERAATIVTELAAYFSGRRTAFEIPIDWSLTTPTQRQVLQCLLQTVGFGESITYATLARRSGSSVPARGIGAIMGANPIPIVVPCHRVVASEGLGGYSGGPRGHGLETKRWLLTFEGVLQPTLLWDPDQPLRWT